MTNTTPQEGSMSTPQQCSDAVLSAYVECALWSTSVEEEYAAANDCAPDVSMESAGFTADDVAHEAIESMREDVESFLSSDDEGCQAALDFWREQHGDAAIGHDFWLTRNGHGAGFWDRWSGGTVGYAHGHVLTAMSKPYGESYLYIADDGLVYDS